jgi:flagellar biosynthetic protein FliR
VSLELPTDLVIGFVLAVVRASAWLVVVPPFNSRTIPVQAKVGLALALAIPAAPMLAETAPEPQVGPLIVATLVQVAAGLTLGFLVMLLFSAVQAAGALIDMFVGFTIAATYDPVSGANTPVIGRFYNLVAVTLLFALDGHLLLVRGFLDSFTAVPAGMPDLGAVSEVFIDSLSLFFLAAIEIALPLLGALFLAEVTLGLLSRAAPQMNVFMLGFPIKILLALVLLGLALPLLPNAVTGLLTEAVSTGRDLTRAVVGAG